MFVAGGTGGKMAYSNDGISWTGVEKTPGDKTGFGTSNIRTIIYGNGKFIAGGQAGKMAYVSWE
jgi:hypothetical protein